MTTTRRDFEATAATIREARALADHAARIGTAPDRLTAAASNRTADHIANGLADHYAATAPRFDRSRFLTACGLTATAAGSAR